MEGSLLRDCGHAFLGAMAMVHMLSARARSYALFVQLDR
jgi:hypothetical protein